MKRATAILWNIIFVGIIVAIPISYVFFHGKLNSENTENRTLAEFPTTNTTSWDKIPQGISDYVDDHFPYKNQVVSVQGEFEYKILNTASDKDVIIGKNDWLFYKGENDNSYNQYKRMKNLSQEEKEIIAMNLNHMKDKVESWDGRFVLFIVPNKSTIYPEFMPDNIGIMDNAFITDELVDFLNENTAIDVVYCKDALLRAKDQFGEDVNLYYKLDTHWNELGAYVGMQPLFEMIDTNIVSVESISYEKDPYSSCDLAALLGVTSKYKSKDNGFIITNYIDDFDIITEETDGLLEYSNSGKDPRKIMFLRDSFTLQMRRILADSFDYCYLQHHNTFDEAQIEEVKPDIFVYELCERRLDELLY